jgi:hypothetical protein
MKGRVNTDEKVVLMGGKRRTEKSFLIRQPVLVELLVEDNAISCSLPHHS